MASSKKYLKYVLELFNEPNKLINICLAIFFVF